MIAPMVPTSASRLPLALAASLFAVLAACPASNSTELETAQLGNRDQLLARINRLSKPVDQHRSLEPLIGQWQGRGTARAAPGIAPETIACRLKNKWVIGERFVQQSLKCVGNDFKLTAVGFLGYDRIAKKFVGAWFSAGDTGFTRIEGVRKDTVTLVLKQQHNDATVMRKTSSTATIEVINPSKMIYLVTKSDPKSGRKTELMRITYRK